MRMNEVNNDLLFLLGVMPRSGTNFLFRSLLNHSEIIRSAQPGEDYLMYASNKLLTYVEGVTKKWSSNWGGMNIEEQTHKLCENLANGIGQYLKPEDKTSNHKYVLCKTPRTDGIHNFPHLFPNSKIIILLRDGKDLVESGVKSFKWTYIASIKEYAKSLERISKFRSIKSNKLCLIVKYEDLVSKSNVEIKRILEFLKLDEAKFDYESFNDLPIFGSSKSIKERSDKFEWKVEAKTEQVVKAKSQPWHPLLRKRYQSICGDFIKEFDYTTNDYESKSGMKYFIKYIKEEITELKRKIRV